MSISLICTLLVLSWASCVNAAGLDLSPIDTTTFSLYVALAAYTLFQTYRAFAILLRLQPKAGSDSLPVPRDRVPYIKIFLATLTCLICYILLTIWIPIDLSMHSVGAQYHNTFYAMMATDQLSDIFIASGLLHFIDNRRDDLGRAHGDANPLTIYSMSSTKKRTLDTIMLYFMAMVIIANVIVGAVLTRTVSDPDAARAAYSSLYHVYLALYTIAAINVALSAWFLWRSLPKTAASTERTTQIILKRVVPLLIVRVLFKLSVDIVTSAPISLNINYDALELIEAIVESLTYAVIIYSTLGLARPIQWEEIKGEKSQGEDNI
ncbi:hypothetical protein DXG03_002018 [Asterophora parasitica]|uniref:Uncharacterized protein n=1 Tax=Asterophora parasitica TaxID=117018 RepID=A0A9P7G664_9AGAR|nr:hypothetical protein DXG03_002018 [Asterophora parasitica]